MIQGTKWQQTTQQSRQNNMEEIIKLFEAGSLDAVLTKIDQFLKTNPNHNQALYYRALTYRRMQKYEESLNVFSILLKLHPTDPHIISEQAVSYFHCGNKEKALELSTEALKLDAKNPYRYSSRAFIKGALKDIEGAISDYKKAIELDPDDAISYNNLGLLEEQLGRMSAAKKNYEASNKLINYEPNNFDKTEENVKKPSNKVGSVSSGNDKLTLKKYFRTMKEVFSSKKERKDFFKFLSGKYKKQS